MRFKCPYYGVDVVVNIHHQFSCASVKAQTWQKAVWWLLGMLRVQVHIPHSLAIMFLSVHSRKRKAYTHMNLYRDAYVCVIYSSYQFSQCPVTG